MDQTDFRGEVVNLHEHSIADLRALESTIGRLSAQIRPDRLMQRTLELVSIPSPPGKERAAAMKFGRCLADAGLVVDLDEEFPESPSVIARSAQRDGPILQLAGHLDTISSAHPPPFAADGAVMGRGACDMKGGLAVIAEVAQILTESGTSLGGSLLVTAYGQHEESAPGRSLHAPLLGLLRRGIKGTACIIPEGPHDELPIAGRGLVIFQIIFARDGAAVHEVLGEAVPPPNPLMASHRFIELLEEASRAWKHDHPLAGSESFFIGSIQGGDYYNRIPPIAQVRGTRRYPPGVAFCDVRDELTKLAHRAAKEIGCTANVVIEKSGQPFSLDPEDLLVAAIRNSYRLQTRGELPLRGMRFSADASQFINVGAITALYHGTNSSTAHSDHESVTVIDLVRCAKVILGSIISYLGVSM
jgi:acetylornithine deacetylase